MTQLRKHTAKGQRSRQVRALHQRNEALTRYGEGDYLDVNGFSLIRPELKGQQRKAAQKRKKARAATDIENLERKLG